MHEEDLIEETKPVDKTSIGYRVGTAFGVLAALCIASIMIAVTAKLIYLIL